MAIDLYYLTATVPNRSVLLTANALGVKLNLKYMDIFKNEQFDPEFLKINPQHCTPTLVDNGFALCESRAIMCYLADQYGKDDSLYPKDPKKRAVVNHRLNFDLGTLYKLFLDYYVPVLYMGADPDPKVCKRLETAFAIFDKYLEGQTWAAGDHLTIADFALVATVSTAEIFDFNVSQFANVSRWLAHAKKNIPKYQEINHAGCLEYKKIKEAQLRPTFL